MTSRSHSPQNQGHILLVSLTLTMIAGLALVVYMKLANNHLVVSARSQTWNSCLPVAEAGIEEALAHINRNHNGNLSVGNWTLNGTHYTKTNVVGAGYYSVQVSTAVPYEIISQGFHPMPDQSATLSRSIRVVAEPDGVFVGALVVKGVIDLNGNNVTTDSYDSSDPNKSTLSQYDPLKAGDKGDIASTGGIINVGNANIWGHAFTGPTPTLSTGPNGAIGSKAWQLGGNSGIEPGWWHKDFNVYFPDVENPFASGVPPVSGTVGGVFYDYILGNGQYHLNQLNGGKILVTGDAQLLVSGEIDVSRSQDLIQIQNGAKFTVYAAGQRSRFGTIVNPNAKPTSFSYFGLPSNTEVELHGVANLRAAVYAPSADVRLVGNSILHGSVVGKTAKLTGNGAVHYDEALRKQGFFRGMIIHTWDEI